MLTRLLERLDLSLTQNPSNLLDTMFLERRDGRHQRDRSLATNDGGGRKRGEESSTKRAISGKANSARNNIFDGSEDDSKSRDDGGQDEAGGNGRSSDNIILKGRNAVTQARIHKRGHQALQEHIRKREYQSALPVNAHLKQEVPRVSWPDENQTGTAPILPIL